jgi:FKBP-type peptidyl-prolyl cis-trans isomerase SlyD
VTDNLLKVVDGVVVSLDYQLRLEENDRVIKSSKEQSPLAFVQGQKQVVPGLERALYGMVVGEEKDITVEAADGYGQIDPAAVKAVPRHRLSTALELIPGMHMRLREKRTGKVVEVKVVEVGSDSVLLDFNHRLAGKTLYYHVRVADLRPATPEELAQSHEQSLAKKPKKPMNSHGEEELVL